jgi:polar amino acid transport system substrate-binding protein
MKLTQVLSALALAVVVSVAVAPAARAADDTIRVATDATFPPLEFVKDGKRTGFDIELTPWPRPWARKCNGWISTSKG